MVKCACLVVSEFLQPMGCSQARILEWVAIPPFPPPGDLPDPGKKPTSPVLQADSLPAEPLGKPFL